MVSVTPSTSRQTERRRSMRIGRRRLLGAFGIGAATSLMAACGTINLSSDRTRTATGGRRGDLIVYSGRSESLVEPLIDRFAEAAGVRVKVKYANTAQLAATILEEGPNSPADIFFAQDPGGLGSIAHFMTPLPDRTVNQVPPWARSPEGGWVGISGRARVVAYNTDKLTESDLPDDIWGLTDPIWRGRMGWAPINASFQTMVTGMRSVWGQERTREWLEGMIANKTGFYPKNTPIVAAVGSGEIELGLVNHYYLYRFLAEEGVSFPVRNYHPRAGGPGALVMVAGAGILDSSKNKDNAARFLEFMLSKTAQRYFASQTYEYPLVNGVPTERLLMPLEEIRQPSISVNDLADLRGTQALLRDTGALT